MVNEYFERWKEETIERRIVFKRITSYSLPKEILCTSNNRTAVNSIDLQDYKLENCPTDLQEIDRRRIHLLLYKFLRSETFNSYPEDTVGSETRLVSGSNSETRVVNKIRGVVEPVRS